jgi:hypothetical protein
VIESTDLTDVLIAGIFNESLYQILGNQLRDIVEYFSDF